MSDSKSDELKQTIQAALEDSERIVEAVLTAINSIGEYSPLSLAYAGLVLNLTFSNQVENWDAIRQFAMKDWATMEEEGSLPTFDDVDSCDAPKPGEYLVKLQTPLATNAPEALAYIYNEDRSIEYNLKIDEEIEKLMNGRPKIFAMMKVDADGTADFKETDWQEW